MDYWDLLVMSAIPAAIFWTLVSTFIQMKWRVYTHVLHKKWGYKIHVGLLSAVSLQLLIVTTLNAIYNWNPQWFSPVGAVLMVGALWLILATLKEGGVHKVFYNNYFSYKAHHYGQLWVLLTEPLYVGYVIFYLGLSILTAHMFFMVAVLELVIGLSLLAYMFPRATK